MTQQKQSIIQIILEVGATQEELCFSPLLFKLEHQTVLLEDENSVSLVLKFQQISSLRLLMMVKIIIKLFLTTMFTDFQCPHGLLDADINVMEGPIQL
jgi:hypothetical protein